MPLQDKVIIVTGAARGLGREYAVRLAQEGARLVLADVQDCAATVERCQAEGAEALALRVDVSDESQTKEMARRAHEQYGRIDGLLNNAGLMRDLMAKSILDVDMDTWDKVFAVNARGTFLCIRAVFPYMRERRRGTIVNVSSGSTLRTARAADENNPHYVSSKAAIIGITRSVAKELGQYNINVVTVAPGAVKTVAFRTLRTALEVREHLGDSEQPHDDRHEPEPVLERADAEREAEPAAAGTPRGQAGRSRRPARGSPRP